MQAFLIFIAFIGLCSALTWGGQKISKNMTDDYKFMRSQAEARDNKQKMSDKVNTSMVGNNTVRNMVNVSMLNHNESDDGGA